MRCTSCLSRAFEYWLFEVGGIITPACDQGDGVYRRVGKFSIYNEHDCGMFMETASEHKETLEMKEGKDNVLEII